VFSVIKTVAVAITLLQGKMKNPSLSSYLLLILVTILLAACAAPRGTAPPPGKPEAPLPTKKVPPSAVPATQRPYVINGKTYYPLPSADGFEEAGVASWYGPNFHGRKTANGETYNMHDARTAAHKTLPINTQLLVKNLENNREIVVRINDRGPFVNDRIIDLTHAGAQELGVLENGTAKVKITALGEAIAYGPPERQIERFLPHEDFKSGDFYVQIGSFTQKSNADRLKDKMLSLGRKSVVQTYDRGDQVFYRVQVWAGRGLEEAKLAATALEQSGYPGYVVAR